MPIGDVHSDARGSGARFNDGKPPMELIPLHLLESTARVFGYGRCKYAAWNWAKGMPWSIPIACMKRHIAALERGEDNDPESGESHIGHIICNALMLEHYRAAYLEGDDRPKEWFQPDAFARLHASMDRAIEGTSAALRADKGHRVVVPAHDLDAQMERAANAIRAEHPGNLDELRAAETPGSASNFPASR